MSKQSTTLPIRYLSVDGDKPLAIEGDTINHRPVGPRRQLALVTPGVTGEGEAFYGCFWRTKVATFPFRSSCSSLSLLNFSLVSMPSRSMATMLRK